MKNNIMQVTTYQQIKFRKEAKYIAPSGPLAHNPSSYIMDYAIEYLKKIFG